MADAQTGDCQSLNFNLATDYKVGPNAYSFSSADFNGDGIIDVITANYDTQTVSVLSGDGAGGFAPPRDFPTGISSVNNVIAGDLNRDGKPDLIAAGYFGGSKLAVLLNNGQGGFLSPTIIAAPSNISEFYNLKVADFNGDGNPDLAGVARTNLNFFLGNGQGGLSLNTTLPWNGNKSEIVVGNFNNDNLLDLVLTGGDFSTPWEFGIVLGKSDGEFVLNKRFSLSNQPTGIVAGEFNGDGLTDIVVAANYTPSNSTPQTFFMEPWLGNGAGDFTAGTKVFLPFIVYGLATGDFNGDGKLDLAASLGSMIATVNGIGDGTFQNKTFWAAPPSDRLLSFDVNQDGKSDLLTIRASYPSSFVSVLLADNNGFATSKLNLYRATDIEAADFNNDGYKDFISAIKQDFYTSEVAIGLNKNRNGLLESQYFETPAWLKAMKTGDFNGDGKKDIITAHSDNVRQLAVYFGDGAGSATMPVKSSLNTGFENLIVGDFNLDGKDDVFAADNNSRVFSLLSNGNGTFTIAQQFPVTLPGNYLKLGKGDFNRDGKIDLIISNGSDVKLWLGDGTGRFTQSETLIPALSEVIVGDFNGDGNLDLAGLNTNGVTAVLGDGNGAFGETFSKASIGQASQLVSADFNSDGSDDIAYISFNQFGNLVVLLSNKETLSWKAPVFYSVGSISNSLIAADFNADNKPDLGFGGSVRGIVYNTNSQNPCITINDVTVTEGDSGATNAIFTVNLSTPSSQIVRVNYTLEGQSAVLGTDFSNISGRLEIPAGQTSATINIPITGDLIDEFDENFTVNLSNPSNASLARATGTGTILDNDAEPTLTVTDVSQVEPTFSQGFNFRVNLSAPSGKPIAFQYATSSGTATPGTDYIAIANSSYTIPAGTTFVNFYVSVINDFIYESDETFFLNISNPDNASITRAQGRATILNDDPVPTVSIFANSVVEGDTGIVSSPVTLQLSNPTYLPVTLHVLTSDGTALGGKDYTATDNVVTIPAEQQSATSNIQITGDTINEPNEYFFVNTYKVANAQVTTTQSQFFILDDESVSNDFDRDGKTDFAVFRPSNGIWYRLFSSTGTFAGTQYGAVGDIPVSGDFNGDGRTDIAVWRPSDGIWYSTIANRSQQWGTAGDIPVQGDYDNDGIIDVAVFRPKTKTWYIRLSSNNSVKYVQWGESADIPVAADYDGDGKTDIAVFRPDTGIWYISRSGDGGIIALQFGSAGDKPVPADYDGDGRADIAVFRDGVWYIYQSSTGNFTSFQWGQAGDKTVPGNYDGDDKTDLAVYRNGTWYIYQSSNGTLLSKQFGESNDIPIPFVSNN